MPDDTDLDHIEINAIHEKWRLECPNGAVGEGHTNWFPIDFHFQWPRMADRFYTPHPRGAVAMSSARTITIDTTNPLDRWRYTCPRGHTTWEVTNNHYWCQKCSQSWNVDPEFSELFDAQSGERIPRNRIRLIG